MMICFYHLCLYHFTQYRKFKYGHMQRKTDYHPVNHFSPRLRCVIVMYPVDAEYPLFLCRFLFYECENT